MIINNKKKMKLHLFMSNNIYFVKKELKSYISNKYNKNILNNYYNYKIRCFHLQYH